MSRLVVADTGPLIHLAQADVLSFLELTGEVLVPRTVLDELERGPTDISELDFAVEGADIDVESVYPHLDSGETVALVVCTERDAILLTDDLDARNTATDEGIEVHGSVGVVLYGYSQGGVIGGRCRTDPSRTEAGYEPVPLDTAHRTRHRVGRVRRRGAAGHVDVL